MSSNCLSMEGDLGPSQCKNVLTQYRDSHFNSWPPGKFERNFRYVIFQGILVNDSWGISCEIALIWMSVDFTDDQSTLVQVMAWCRQAASHYLSQCWPRSLMPYGVTRPQWVKDEMVWWSSYLYNGKPQMWINSLYIQTGTRSPAGMPYSSLFRTFCVPHRKWMVKFWYNMWY